MKNVCLFSGYTLALAAVFNTCGIRIGAITVYSKNKRAMNKLTSPGLILAMVLSGITLTGCELAGDIFEAGVWIGIIVVVLVIVVIGAIIRKIF